MAHNDPPGLPAELAAIISQFYAKEKSRQDSVATKSIAQLWDAWYLTVRSESRVKSIKAHRFFLGVKAKLPGGEEFTLGALPFGECGKEHVAAWLEGLASARGPLGKTPSPGYRHNVRISLTSCFEHHIAAGTMTRNPLTGIPFEKDHDRYREGYFTPEVFDQFLKDCHPLLADVLRTSARCGGLRMTEVRCLRKDQVDHERRLFIVVNKGGKKKQVIITDDIYDMVVARSKLAPGEFVFANPRDPRGGPVPQTTLGDMMRAHRKRTGITLLGEKPVIHHARHTFAVTMLGVGEMSDQWTSQQLGHRDTRQLSRYGKMRGAATEIARDKMNRSPIGRPVVAPGAPPAAPSYPCEVCGKPCPGAREAVACMDAHEAAGASPGAPARQVIPMASFDKQGRKSR